MKFDDIDTRRLLPHWAHDADWIQAAFDEIAKAAFDRAPAIDVPLTMQAIRTLSDSELQAWYASLVVVEYYPDLSRETREKMLYWCARLYRFLGTPQAVRILCEYVHDGLPMNVDVRDNLAWDGTTLVDPQLLDVFDIAIDAEDVHITPMFANRILQNVLRIARNSQALRNIIYRYTTQIDVPVAPADAPSAAVTEFVDVWEVSAPQMPMVWRYDEDVLPFETVAPGGTFATGLLYSASSLYAPVVAVNDPMATHPDFFGWGTEESSGHVAIVNNTGSSRSVMVVTIYHMAAECAELVTVKNGQNERFNAFKFFHNGDPWWFVIAYAIDGWINDLEAESYEEVPAVVLPMVELPDYWLTPAGAPATMAVNQVEPLIKLYTASDKISYDSSCSYAIREFSPGSGVQPNGGIFTAVDDSSYVAAKNISSSPQSLYTCRIAVCSSNQATVVTVYNSSNVAYNAFKFTASGTDYYYVLDGVQTDWTDDLSSIGYSLYLTAYASGDYTNFYLGGYSGTRLVDYGGNYIRYSGTYTLARIEKSDGTVVDSSHRRLGNDSGYLIIYNGSSDTLVFSKVYYAVS